MINLKSMTGYGRSEGVYGTHQIVFEIKSVNHRYFEFSCRAPRSYGYLEEKLKSYLQSFIGRGKVEAFVSITSKSDTPTDVEVNHSLAEGYIGAMRDLINTYGLQDDLSVSVLARYSDIFSVSKTTEDEDEVWRDVKSAVDDALKGFILMRETEGEKLKEDINRRAAVILEIVSEIEEQSPITVLKYRERLVDRMNEVLNLAGVDEQRILTEAAIFADRVAVDEETVRLRSHFSQLDTVMNTSGAVGRKIDFIVQEMNREANTIGSKVQDAGLAHKVVNIKAEIEKIREQVQNIE